MADAREPGITWPPGLLGRVKAAEQRIHDNHAPRRIPADPHGDVDLVLAEVRYLIEGNWPPFWIKDAPGVETGETPSLRAAAELAIKALDEEAAAYAPDRLAHVDEAAAALRAALALGVGGRDA